MTTSAIERIRIERRRAGAAQNMLRQHVEPALAQPVAVEFAGHHRIARRFAFQHLEAVRRHQQRLRRLVEPMIGAADALHQPRGAFRRADADHLIHRAPVDAEIERRGADHRAQIALRHRAFDLAALARRERTVMQRDREVVLVDAPEILEGAVPPARAY